ncbi:MAG TPA: tetratricopeptide repeat protein, partial [Thermoanaerobaculia bacterium]
AYLKLRDEIEPYVKAASAPLNIDPEEAAKLAALGYVGSTVDTSNGAPLPDPKSMMGPFHDIRVAYTLYRDGKEPEALQLTTKLLADNSQITDLWDLKAKILYKMGRERDSIEAAKDGLRHVPTAIALLYDVANLALTMGDLDTAQKHAEIAVKIEPGEAHDILSRIWMRRNDVKRAEEEAKLAVDTAHDPTNPLIMLGGIERNRGNLPAALAYYQRALITSDKAAKPSPGLHSAMGDVLARLGRNEEAEREFRIEIAKNPSSSDAYASLVMLLAVEHRLDEATKLIFDVVKAVPQPHTYTVVAETLTAIGDDRGALFWAFQGQQKYPGDPELKRLPQHVRDSAPLLRKRMLN